MGCGAALGAAARFAFLQALGPAAWATVAVNALGCFLMGRFRPGLFWGTGALGGFTTFSGFLLYHSPLPLTVTLVCCPIAWYLGDAAYRRAVA